MTTRPFSQRPKAVLLLSGVIAAEGILIGYLAALQLIEIITGAVVVLVTGLSLLALLLGVTLWLFYVARSLLAAKRWARSGALFWQLIQLAVASASSSRILSARSSSALASSATLPRRRTRCSGWLALNTATPAES